MEGRPTVTSKTVTTKKVTMVLSAEEAREAIEAYIVKRYAEFRGMTPYTFSPLPCNITITAERKTET